MLKHGRAKSSLPRYHFRSVGNGYRLESKKNSATDHRVKGWSDNYENAHETSKIINAIKETRMVTRLDFRICHLEGGT